MRLGLDIDDVICNFTSGIFRAAGIPESRIPEVVSYDYREVFSFKPVWNVIKDDESFWLSLPPMESKIPSCCTHYVTARYCSNEITKKWLLSNGFPLLTLVNTNHVHTGTKKDLSKAEKICELGLDGIVEDKAEHYLEVSAVSRASFLVSRPWNRHVSTPNRIYRLEELEWRIPHEVMA